jgi:acetyl-CoA carboxylase carboxyltransferase component
VRRNAARGKLLPRDRIDRLLDPGASFLEQDSSMTLVSRGGKFIRSPALGINSGRHAIKKSANLDGLSPCYSREANPLRLF